MRLAASLAIAALAAALLAGCGSSSDEKPQTGSGPAAEPSAGAEAPVGAAAKGCDTYAVDAEGLRVTGVSCDQGRQVMFSWQRAEGCGLIGKASRGSCAVRSYRCLTTKADRGVAVSCARPGRSIAFVAKRG